MEKHLIWIPLLPFLGFLVNGILGKRLGTRFVSTVGCIAPLGAFAVTVAAWGQLQRTGVSLHSHLFDWISLTSFSAPFALFFDPIAAVMCMVVTGVGSLIHLYSTRYMRGDPGYFRFFAYLNLFTAFMLILVLADNLLLLFVGWEGVGLCSYLLIGFWYNDPQNCQAGNKAFIVNRIGDFAFLLGIFLVFQTFATLDLQTLVDPQTLAAASTKTLGSITSPLLENPIPISAVVVITLLLFGGAVGKSAQIPLYVWLPDAMAGPTPVSALIHAATMVTSGVYLCCRLAPLFASAPFTMTIIAAIGALTALWAALIALTQNDIKKVLAYSTVSQLGYMFFAVGVGAFGAALFHLVTHAFFKALLFLGSGSVIVAMHHEQDMRRMGGLRESLPFTHIVFVIGTFAISGVPLFSGFFSKDEILFAGLESALHSSLLGWGFLSWMFWGMAFLTAGLTAFYMLRVVALTFWGESRVDPELAPKVQEPGGWMGLVLLVLAVLSVTGGVIGIPEFLGGTHILGHFTGLQHLVAPELHSLEWTSALISVAIASIGLLMAWFVYGRGQGMRRSFVDSSLGSLLTRWSSNKFYVDELYQTLIVGPLRLLAYLLFWIVDRLLIDKVLVDGSGRVTRSIGEMFRRMQSGYVPAYLLTFGCGALVLLFLMMVLLKGGA
ncbi:MAG: NADH-quinone oxidoreductase subunit L [Planctomycetota bacterium]